jgi:hypothetical protein
MSVTTESGAEAHFSIANHIGHGLGVLISAGNVLVGISPEAREGDGYNGNTWIDFVGFGTIGRRRSHRLVGHPGERSTPNRGCRLGPRRRGESRGPLRPGHWHPRSHRQLGGRPPAARSRSADPATDAQGPLDDHRVTAAPSQTIPV